MRKRRDIRTHWEIKWRDEAMENDKDENMKEEHGKENYVR